MSESIKDIEPTIITSEATQLIFKTLVDGDMLESIVKDDDGHDPEAISEEFSVYSIGDDIVQVVYEGGEINASLDSLILD